MSRLAIAVVFAALSAGPVLAQKAPSVCKGLEQAQCVANAACGWRGALVKGETLTKAGAPSKVSRKAHCAKKPSRAAKQ